MIAYRILSPIIIAITSFLYLPRINGLYITLISHTARDTEGCQCSSESSISASTLHTGTFVSIKFNRTLYARSSVLFIYYLFYFILQFYFLRMLLRVCLLIRWKNTKWVKKSLIHVRNPNIRKRTYMPHHYKLHSYCIFRPNRNIWKETQISQITSTFVWKIFPVPFGT